MTKLQILNYQQRWNRVQKAQSRELKTLSMPLKFKQLCFLMNSFSLISTKDQYRRKEVNQTRQHWLRLKQ